MNGVPLARAPFSAMSSPGRTAGSAISSGNRNVIANGEPRASPATSCSVAALASFVRYMLTPVDTTTAGLLDDQILDKTCPRDDRRAKRPRELRIHVAAAGPVFGGRRQLQRTP